MIANEAKAAAAAKATSAAPTASSSAAQHTPGAVVHAPHTQDTEVPDVEWRQNATAGAGQLPRARTCHIVHESGAHIVVCQ